MLPFKEFMNNILTKTLVSFCGKIWCLFICVYSQTLFKWFD